MSAESTLPEPPGVAAVEQLYNPPLGMSIQEIRLRALEIAQAMGGGRPHEVAERARIYTHFVITGDAPMPLRRAAVSTVVDPAGQQSATAAGDAA